MTVPLSSKCFWHLGFALFLLIVENVIPFCHRGEGLITFLIIISFLALKKKTFDFLPAQLIQLQTKFYSIGKVTGGKIITIIHEFLFFPQTTELKDV